ncbi:MAG TPA: helix-turn-helix domain-containing protein [Chiayiivirga sp.]|nr:helix-turn-helix domain-containing protein [Chiayiivirga sp.]
MRDTTTAPLAHPVPAACARLGISRTTLYQLLGNGELRAIKVGCKTLIPESELRRFVESRLEVAA